MERHEPKSCNPKLPSISIKVSFNWTTSLHQSIDERKDEKSSTFSFVFLLLFYFCFLLQGGIEDLKKGFKRGFPSCLFF